MSKKYEIPFKKKKSLFVFFDGNRLSTLRSLFIVLFFPPDVFFLFKHFFTHVFVIIVFVNNFHVNIRHPEIFKIILLCTVNRMKIPAGRSYCCCCCCCCCTTTTTIFYNNSRTYIRVLI